MSATRRVFIDGEAGTTGLSLRARLMAEPAVTVISLPEERRKDPCGRREAMAAANVVVLCLPDQAAREAVAMAEGLGPAAPRLIDASTAHRTAPGWVYGFAELDPLQPGRIASARLVANPGCYATGAIALIRPLVDAGLLAPDQPLTITAVSGYSGGGKSLIAAHELRGGPALELYALGLDHKHVPEIMCHGRLKHRPLFLPSVGHFCQGLLVSLPLLLDQLPGRPTAADLAAALSRRYGSKGQVRVAPLPASARICAEGYEDSDRMELFVCADEAHRHAVLIARLDNLGKGAAGAALQNLRLMLGLAPVAAAMPA